MEASKSRKNGIALLLLSFLLALFFTVWPILDYRVPTGVSTFTIRSFMALVGSCIGMILAILGIRLAKRAGISWSLIVLSVVSVLLHGSNAIGIPYSWLNPPEVKGIVRSIDADHIVINIDKNYLPEYSTAHLPDGSTTDLVAGISSRTIFYEQYGNWRWQKKVVNLENVQKGQHIQIQYNGLRVLTGDIIEVGEIVILNQ